MEILDTEVKESHPTAKISAIGLNSNLFGTDEGGKLLGQKVSVLHVYPIHDLMYKTDLSYDHAIVQVPDESDSRLITDVKLSYD